MSDIISDSGFGISSMVVEDRSVATPSVATSTSNFSVLAPIFASSGIDNKIQLIRSNAEMMEKYGNDVFDFNKYGQQNLNVEQFIANGGNAYCCRLLPDDATQAHAVISVQLKANDVIPVYKRDIHGSYVLDDNGDKIQETISTPNIDGEGNVLDPTITGVICSGVELRLISTVVPESILSNSANLDDAFEAIGKNISGIVEDVEDQENEPTEGPAEEPAEFINIPLFAIKYYANGKSGNNIGFQIKNNFTRDNATNDGRRYTLNIRKKTSLGSTIVPYCEGLGFSFNPTATVSLYNDSIEGLQSVYPNTDKLFNEQETQLTYFYNNYAVLIEQIQKILDEGATPTTGYDSDNLTLVTKAEEVDFVNGFSKDGVRCDNILINTVNDEMSGEENVSIKDIVFLKNGTEGKLDTLKGDALQDCKNQLLIDFYNYRTDTSTICDVLLCPAGITFDANYDIKVKQSMVKLSERRQDIAVVFDCGKTANVDEAAVVARDLKSLVQTYGSEKYTAVPHFGTTVNRKLQQRLTGTYEFAGGISAAYKKGLFSVYAGVSGNTGCVRNMIFDWVVGEDLIKGRQKKIAEDARMYYAINVGKAVATPATGNLTNRNVYFFSDANFYPEKYSKLAEFRNGVLIGEIKRLCKTILVKYCYTQDKAAKSMVKAATEMNEKIKMTFPSSVSIVVETYQTSEDVKTDTCTCKIHITFPNVIKEWSCTITANRDIVE